MDVEDEFQNDSVAALKLARFTKSVAASSKKRCVAGVYERGPYMRCLTLDVTGTEAQPRETREQGVVRAAVAHGNSARWLAGWMRRTAGLGIR